MVKQRRNKGLTNKHPFPKVSWEDREWAKRFMKDRCDCCRKIPNRSLHIDHDHTIRGRAGLRGWLCMSCNVALGHIRDSIPTLKNMITYLKTPPFYNAVREKKKLLDNAKKNGGVVFSIKG